MKAGQPGMRQPKDRPTKAQAAFMFASLVGRPVKVQLRGGKLFSGIFHACLMEKDYSIALKFVQEIPQESGGVLGEILNTMLIPGRELVMLKADKVPINGQDVPENKGGDGGFLDADITARRNQMKRAPREGRELEQWNADGDGEEIELEKMEPNFRASGIDTSGEWDQFAVNEKMFGCKSTYREELYTTKLDMSKVTRSQAAEADRIAKEIEADGKHGGDENTGEDEEAMFSAVMGSGGYKGRQRSGDHVRALLNAGKEEEQAQRALAQAPHAHMLEKKQREKAGQHGQHMLGQGGFDMAFERSAHGKQLPNGALMEKD